MGVEGTAAYGDHAGAVLIGHVRGAKREESPAAQDLLRAAVERLQIEPYLEVYFAQLE